MKHVFRETNKCADALARICCNIQEELVIFDFPPIDVIAALVSADKMGKAFVGMLPQT